MIFILPMFHFSNVLIPLKKTEDAWSSVEMPVIHCVMHTIMHTILDADI